MLNIQKREEKKRKTHSNAILQLITINSLRKIFLLSLIAKEKIQ